MQATMAMQHRRILSEGDNNEQDRDHDDMDVDPFLVVDPNAGRPVDMLSKQIHLRPHQSLLPQQQRSMDLPSVNTSSAHFPGVTTPDATPSSTPEPCDISFLSQQQKQQQQQQQQGSFEIGFGSSEISLADTLTFGGNASVGPKTSASAGQNTANLTPGSPKKSSANRNSFGRPGHLPFLNLSAVKNYAGWPGSPIKPPTPLAHPPTPLSHPAAANYAQSHGANVPHCHQPHQDHHSQAQDSPTHPPIGAAYPSSSTFAGLSSYTITKEGGKNGKPVAAHKMVRSDGGVAAGSPVTGKGGRPLSRIFEQPVFQSSQQKQQQHGSTHEHEHLHHGHGHSHRQLQHPQPQQPTPAAGTLRPFALPPSQTQQYMSYNLDEFGKTNSSGSPSPNPAAAVTPISPPPTPGVPEGQQTIRASELVQGLSRTQAPQARDGVQRQKQGSPMAQQEPSVPTSKGSSTALAPSVPPRPKISPTPAPSPETSLSENIIPPGLQAKAAKPNAIPTVAEFLASGRISEVLDQQYELLEELGAGGFGFVLRARRRYDGLIVAIKFIFRERIPSHGWVRTRSWTRTADGQPGVERLVPLEAYVLRMIRHPGVVAFLDLIEDDKVMYLVMEHHGTPWTSASSTVTKQTPSKSLAVNERALPNTSSGLTGTNQASDGGPGSNQSSREGSPDAAPSSDDIPDISFSSSLSSSPSSSMGPPTPNTTVLPLKLAPPPMLRRSSCDLFECIEQHSRLPEEHARLVFGQIAEVVYHLATMGICHRDIKDENIVVDENFRVKLIDFGSAVMYDPRKEPPYHNRFFGTVNFAASEILQGQPYRAPHAEVWSLGVLLSILLTGETPFSSPDNAINGRISKPKWPVPAMALDLMFGCLQVDPETRFTISQVRHHPWLYLPPHVQTA